MGMREKDPSKAKSQDDESVMSNNDHAFSGTGGINIPTTNQQMMEQMRHNGLSQSLNSDIHSDFSGSSASHNNSVRSREMRQKFQRGLSLDSSSGWCDPESSTSNDSSRRRQFRMMKHEESFSELQIPKPAPESENRGQLDEGELMNQSLVSMEMQSIEKSAVFMSINDMIMSSLNEVVADVFDSDNEEIEKESLASSERKKKFLSSGDNSNTINFDQQNENFNNARSSDYNVWNISESFTMLDMGS